MRKFLPAIVGGIAAISFSVYAADSANTVQRTAPAATTPGNPGPQAPSAEGKGGASAGSSSPDEIQRRKERGAAEREDERRATERKEKAKQRPGYQEEAPSPRAAR